MMTHFEKLAAGLSGLAAIAAVSAPATAQMYPYNPGNNGGVVGAIVDAVTGYGQYPQGNYGYEQSGQRNSVELCARTAEQRLNGDQRYNGYGNGYGQGGYGNGYGRNGYRNGGTFRVVGITNVERRMNGSLKVRGIASSGVGYGNGWNRSQGDVQRNDGNGHDSHYGNADANHYGDADANHYGYGNNGYRSAGMDYRFTCKINARGAVTSLNLDRGTRSLRG